MFDTPVSTESDLAETASRPLASVQPASRPVASQRLESQLLDPRPTDPRKKCPDLLANEITTLAGHLNAAQYRFLKLLDEFDREQGWAGPGVRSLAHWLNWKCGLGDLVAREKVRVARALRELPMIDATFEQGQLLVKALDAMVAEMEKDEREAASETAENVSAETFSVGKPDTPPFKPLRVRRATALVHIAEHYLATRGSGATPLKSSDAYQVFVHVNANDAHPDNRINGAHTIYTDDRRSLAPHVARQLACDASHRTVLENERGEVLNIGRRSRTGMNTVSSTAQTVS